MLTRYFELDKHRTTIATEVSAGFTTFLTMAYIIVVNPSILADAGMDKGAVFVATCLAAAFGSAAMGLYANYPIALAPGMGLNAFFTYAVVKGMGHDWQTALAAVFLSGVLFLIVSLTHIRAWVIDSIPLSLKMATAAGIGMFLGLIALQSAGLVVRHPVTLVTLGDLRQPSTMLAVIGFMVMVALNVRRIPGAILIAILAVAAAGAALGLATFHGIAALPPSLAPVIFKLDFAKVVDAGLVSIVLTFFFVDVFDNTGTLVALAHKAGLIGPDGQVRNLQKALVVDSASAMVGALLGTSTTTSYIESAAGVNAGGRSGLVAVTVAALFLLSLFLAPLAGSIPPFATAPALFYVACLMMSAIKEVDFEDLTEYVPAVLTMAAMPFTFSIANGLALGIVAWTAIKALSGRWAELNAAMLVLSAIFVAKFALIG